MGLRKKKGNVDEMIVSLIGIFILFVVLIGSLNYINTTIKFTKAHQIARKYTLKMESQGELSPENIVKLRNELTNQGFTNIDLSASTTTKVNYGDDVILDIKYDQVFKKIEMNGLSLVTTDEIKKIHITKSSTGKH